MKRWYFLVVGIFMVLPAFGMGRMGEVNITLDTLEAHAREGQRAPEYDQQCVSLYGHYLSTPMQFSYGIDPESLLEDGKVQFAGQLSERSIEVMPMGLRTTYGFIASHIPTGLHEKRVLSVVAGVNKQFAEPYASVMFDGVDKKFTCVLSHGSMN